MAKVDFTVTIMGGTGIGVFIKVDDKVMHFETSGNKSIDLKSKGYIAQVSGSEPSDGSVEIVVSEGGIVLRKARFTESSFWALMPFTVS